MAEVALRGFGVLKMSNWQIEPTKSAKIQELKKPKPTGELTLVYYLNRRDGIEKIRRGELSGSRVLNPLSDYNYEKYQSRIFQVP